MRVRLNLATKPLVTHRRFLAGSAALGIVAMIAFALLGWNVYNARKADAEMRQKTAAIRGQVAELQQQRETLDRFFNLEENRTLQERASYINGLIDARSFNWTLMFMDLEKLLPAGVRVVSIEPKQEKGRVEVKFSIGATSEETSLKFLKSLEDSKSFTHVQLTDVHRPNTPNSSDQVIAELTAEYLRS